MFDDADVVVLYASPASGDAGARSALRQILTHDELQRASRFVRDADRELFVTARALLRHALALTTGRRDWQLAVGRYGKPELFRADGGPAVKFNLTHTAGLAACAVSLAHEVGVDAENLGRLPDYDAVAQICLSDPERRCLANCPPEARGETFYRLWTIKEAVAKAIGKGLSLSLSDITVELQPVSISFDPSLPEDPHWWHIEECKPTTMHALALAVRRPPSERIAVRWQSVDISQI